MARTSKTVAKKSHSANLFNNPRKSNSNKNTRSFSKKNIVHHLIHPDYILFDWEFYSCELEFE